MDITINLNSLTNLLNIPPDEALLRVLLTVGWIPIALTLLWGFWQVWVFYIQDKFAGKQKYLFLAIDIPKGNSQSPKAVENLFAYIAGAHSTLNLIDQFWDGKFQLAVSFEIVSIDGYTQFVIRTPEGFKSLVESAIYSQYPDAEITEINDYTVGMPKKFPDDEYDIWGAEFIQNISPAYPIKCYEDFEHQMGEPEFHFRDPMASLMDLCSSLKPGEQLWFQVIVWPTHWDWPIVGEKEISKILKEKAKVKTTLANKAIDGLINIITEMTGYNLMHESEVKKEDDALKMMNLKPREKKQIEAIQDKISKLLFEEKLRFVYIAKKDVMNKQKVVNGFVGFMKQFAYNDLNNLKPDMKITATSTNYLMKESRLIDRKNKIINNYMGRSSKGRSKGLMNSQELATLWHFPIESVVRAPSIQKAPGRKSEPPTTLPIGESYTAQDRTESIFDSISEEDLFGNQQVDKKSVDQQPENDSEKNKEEVSNTPPENLPFV